MFVQFFLFPPAARRYGVLGCFRVCLCALPLLYLLTPYSVLIPSPNARLVVIYFILVLKGCACVFAFPCSTIMLTNSASSLRILGTLNGIATSVSAIGRAAGPAIGGTSFTFGVERGYVIIPWWIFCAMALLNAFLSFFLVEGKGFGDSDSDSGSVTAAQSPVAESEGTWVGSDSNGAGLGTMLVSSADSAASDATEAFLPHLSHRPSSQYLQGGSRVEDDPSAGVGTDLKI
jgi:hypothetical protein